MDKLLKQYINNNLGLKEGTSTKAITQGINCEASGLASFAGGIGTQASKDGQTVVGIYNSTDVTSLFVIGGGESSVTKSNAFSVGRNLEDIDISLNGITVSSKKSYIKIGQVIIPENKANIINEAEEVFEHKLPDTPESPSTKILNGNRQWVPASVLGGFDKNYRHSQDTAASVWIVNHGLNKFPSVTVIDSANSVVVGDLVYNSTNILTITFSSQFAGQAYLN